MNDEEFDAIVNESEQRKAASAKARREYEVNDALVGIFFKSPLLIVFVIAVVIFVSR